MKHTRKFRRSRLHAQIAARNTWARLPFFWFVEEVAAEELKARFGLTDPGGAMGAKIFVTHA